MLLSRPTIAGTLASLGETEARSAGEQLAEGYLSRAVTDYTSGEVCGPPPPPLPQPLLSAHASKNSRPKGGTKARWLSPANVVRISGKMWSYYPERALPKANSRRAHHAAALMAPSRTASPLEVVGRGCGAQLPASDAHRTRAADLRCQSPDNSDIRGPFPNRFDRQVRIEPPARKAAGERTGAS